MTDRNSIHKLIDTLPEESLETAEQILRSSQRWKPQPPQNVRQMRQSVRALMLEQHDADIREHITSAGEKIPLTFGPDAPREASGVAWEGGTLVTFRICRLHGHALEIEERFSIPDDKSKLLYSQQIQGPKGKKESFEIEFECR